LKKGTLGFFSVSEPPPRKGFATPVLAMLTSLRVAPRGPWLGRLRWVTGNVEAKAGCGIRKWEEADLPTQLPTLSCAYSVRTENWISGKSTNQL